MAEKVINIVDYTFGPIKKSKAFSYSKYSFNERNDEILDLQYNVILGMLSSTF